MKPSNFPSRKHVRLQRAYQRFSVDQERATSQTKDGEDYQQRKQQEQEAISSRMAYYGMMLPTERTKKLRSSLRNI